MQMKKKKISELKTTKDTERNFLIHEKNCVIQLDDTSCRKNTVLPYIHNQEEEFAIKVFLNAKVHNLI